MTGIDGDVMYYVFPQGGGRLRLYIGYDIRQKHRYVGADAVSNFLRSFNLPSLGYAEALCAARPCGPCHSYPNADSWIDLPVADGVVLIGDAAGHNDPTIGQGLSIAVRDARLVSECLADDGAWSMAALQPYVAERKERMRRLRFTGRLVTALRDFPDDARARRLRAYERMAADPGLGLPLLPALKGPFAVPDGAFEQAAWDRLLG